jgi:hypothetical protein
MTAMNVPLASKGGTNVYDMTREFITCGTQAVLDLRTECTDGNESLIFETNLNRRMAEILKADRQLDVRRDPFYYTTALKILGLDVSSPAIAQAFGQYSADMGVLRPTSNPVLLEVKIVKDFRKLAGVIDDRNHLQRLAMIAPIDGYVGVLVCQDRETNVRETIKSLKAQLGLPVSVGDILPTKSGAGWEWAFVCAKVTGSLAT